MKTLIQYKCPKCGAIYSTDGWCPECEEGLVAVLVEDGYSYAADSLHFNPKEESSYDEWVKRMIDEKNK
ncbi:MAG: hypothetical protein MJ066_02585 [Clostridia bacterium]|nr:hypothetical protein [Clostridia bacterium]